MNSVDPLQRFLVRERQFHNPAVGTPWSAQEFQVIPAQHFLSPMCKLQNAFDVFYSRRGWKVQLNGRNGMRANGLNTIVYHNTGFDARSITCILLSGNPSTILITVNYNYGLVEKEGIPFFIGEEVLASDYSSFQITELHDSSVKFKVKHLYDKIAAKGYEKDQVGTIYETSSGGWVIEESGTLFVKIEQDGFKAIRIPPNEH